MKYLKVCQKYSTACHTFNSVLSVSSGVEKLRLMLDISQLKYLGVVAINDESLWENSNFFAGRIKSMTAET